MKKFDFSKSAEALKSAANKVGEAGKSVVKVAKDNAQLLAERAQVMAEVQQAKNKEALIKKLNPLFPDDYRAVEFKLPNLIRIVDDAVRRGIDVCEGAIGWLTTEKGVEVLHLYDEAVEFSGLKFLPAATCDSIYYVDPHNRNHFISVDCYFSSMQESRLAELQHIAYSLGAKHYWVEMVESTYDKQNTFKSAIVNAKVANASGSEEQHTATTSKSMSVAEAVFSSGRKPVNPDLCWFSNDNNVLNLIKMRCSKNSQDDISTYTIELSSSNAATMSVSAAAKIDSALSSLKVGANTSFSSNSEKEHNRKMYFKLEF